MTPYNQSTPKRPLLPLNIMTSSQLALPKSTGIPLLRRERFHIPNHLCILIDTSIAAKESHSRHTQNRLSNPLILVLVRLVN